MRATRTTGSLGAWVHGCTGAWEQGDFSLAPLLPAVGSPARRAASGMAYPHAPQPPGSLAPMLKKVKPWLSSPS